MSLLEQVKQKLPEAIISSHNFFGDETIVVSNDSLIEVMRTLKDNPQFDFNFLMDLSGVDYLTFGEKWPRFEVVYHLYSTAKNHRVRVKVAVEEKNPSVPSVVSLWPAADWYEREVWDMYGICFAGHPNLKRILMYDEFVGHPLRKDYPVNKRQPLIGPKN